AGAPRRSGGAGVTGWAAARPPPAASRMNATYASQSFGLYPIGGRTPSPVGVSVSDTAQGSARSTATTAGASQSVHGGRSVTADPGYVPSRHLVKEAPRGPAVTRADADHLASPAPAGYRPRLMSDTPYVTQKVHWDQLRAPH